MTKETKDDIIKMLKQDLRILRLEKDNKQLQLDNLLLIVLTLQRERDIYLEKDRQALEKMNENEFVPCLFLRGKGNKVLIHFHANGEDIGSTYGLLMNINMEF